MDFIILNRSMYRSFVPSKFGRRRTRKRRLFGKKQPHIIEHIGGGSDQFCALLNEAVRPDGRGVVDTTGHGVNRTSLLASLIRADQGPALRTRLDNQHPQTNTR